MAYSQSLAQQIRKILALKLPPQIFEEELEEKKLFGGLAFMIRGKMVLTVSSRKDELVMVRTGYGQNWQGNGEASSTPNRSSYYIDEGAPLSWVYRLRYRRSKRIALLD